jgi:hypothetical protein
MALRTWIDKLLGRQTASTEPPPPRGLDEPVNGPEEEAAAAQDQAADLNERLRKAEDRPATPPDSRNP